MPILRFFSIVEWGMSSALGDPTGEIGHFYRQLRDPRHIKLFKDSCRAVSEHHMLFECICVLMSWLYSDLEREMDDDFYRSPEGQEDLRQRGGKRAERNWNREMSEEELAFLREPATRGPRAPDEPIPGWTYYYTLPHWKNRYPSPPFKVDMSGRAFPLSESDISENHFPYTAERPNRRLIYSRVC